MIEVGPNLFHASGPRPQSITVDLVAIAVVRDEMWRLPFFLAYHRWLGVQHFIIIDNRSNDGTPDYLGCERDVTCVLAPGSFAGPTGKWSWIVWAMRFGPPERWNLLLDADELFIGAALRPGDLLLVKRELDAEGAAAAVASMVDCYPAEFPCDARHFEPVPWQRAPYFDRGPYFCWPESQPQMKYIYHGVRERACWPHWRWARHLRNVVPRPLRPRAVRERPPSVSKVPLLRNVPTLKFHDVHVSTGAPRSKSLFAVLHYKFDIDLPMKVDMALRERQYARRSVEYEGYARMLARPRCDLRSEATCRFYGVRSLVDARLVAFDNATADNAWAGELLLPEVAQQVWQHGNYALQRQVWKHQ